MNVVTNNKNIAGQIASDKIRFGECGRYAIAAVHTRFDAVQWFVWDAERPGIDGFATIIRQENTYEKAIEGLN